MYFKRPEQIEFAVVFAYIYDGVPNWRSTDAAVLCSNREPRTSKFALITQTVRSVFAFWPVCPDQVVIWKSNGRIVSFLDIARWTIIIILDFDGLPARRNSIYFWIRKVKYLHVQCGRNT